MDVEIRDPSTGTGAKVDSNQFLKVRGFTEVVEHYSLQNGKAWNINTGNITLTSACSSAVLYVSYTGEEELDINSFIHLLGTSTGGCGDWTVEVIRNPTAGTIIDNATTFTIYNRNFGSNVTLDATVYKGAEGYTFTDGEVAIQSIIDSSGRNVVGVPIHLTKGTSMGIKITPPPGNTSATIQTAITPYIG